MHPLKQCSFYILLTCITACAEPEKHNSAEARVSADSMDNVSVDTSYIHLDKLSIHGDFDGDGTIDTIRQNNINRYTRIPIDSFPDMDEGLLQHYFDTIHSDIILTFLHKPADTLHLDYGKGLYCLINIGDNNHDKKDEIAFVRNVCDFTNINTCFIYTYCTDGWVELTSFKVHEDAFYTTDRYAEIKGYLEYRNKKWVYLDYYTWFNAEKASDTTMVPLKIKACKQI